VPPQIIRLEHGLLAKIDTDTEDLDCKRRVVCALNQFYEREGSLSTFPDSSCKYVNL
jgi:hypothetical protein